MTRSGALEGRRALVTGAGAGIGEAIATALVGEGARVAVTDLDGARAAAVAESLGGRGAAFPLDVTDAAQTERVFAEVVERLGGLDIVCANAGTSTMNRIVDLSERDWDLVLDTNAKGTFLTNRAAVARFIAQGDEGVIVNTASITGKAGYAFMTHYSASKFAIVGLTQALAREVAEHGIRVNAVCPGFVRTAMQEREIVREAELRGMTPEAVRAEYVAMSPLGRLEEVEDVADVVVFLASDAARFMTGQAINVTGGSRMD